MKRVPAWTWPAAAALAGGSWYAADSLRHRREGAFGYNLEVEIDVASADFVRACEALTGAPVSDGNSADLLINGDRIFPSILETIESAEHTLNLETYVYWRGEVTDRIAAAICERAQAGVECNVLLDAVGSALMDPAQISTMRSAGVNVWRLRPPKPYAIRRLANRSHRRVLVADGKVGMTGGVGIAEQWTGNAEDPEHWRDTHVRVRGPVVRSLQGAFSEHWLEATGTVLGGEGHLPGLESQSKGCSMQLVRSKAGVGDTNVEALYYLAIASASETIDLSSAYFAPRPAFAKAIGDAAERGVRVRVLVPGPNIDKQLVRVAGRAAYEGLLAAGVEICEYQPTMLHAKTMVVDGIWSSVGSVNFDNRSFQLNDEATLCVWDRDFAGRLGDAFEADIGRADAVDLDRWRRRSPRQRAAEAASRLARREL